jgi:hypothetical protein
MTVEEMRSLGQVVREAGRLLSLQKGVMFAEHKSAFQNDGKVS